MTVKFTDAIQIATAEAMKDPRVHVLGLGATYPNGLDGTMGNLAEIYPGRVHDTPCSEAAVTGMAIGMAINGLLPIVHHGRIEFALYAMNQILTETANWDYMFGGDYKVPLVIRIAIGRQWGNGPAHTRAAKGLFAVPGLKVVCPSSPYMAYELLHAAVHDPGPVVYLEPRWLYKTTGSRKFDGTSTDLIRLDKAVVLREGSKLTVVGIGDSVLDILKGAKGTDGIEIIDAVSVYPIDVDTICKSVMKTGKLLVVESAPLNYSVAHEILAHVTLNCTLDAVAVLGCDNIPCPTAPSLTAEYYPTDEHVRKSIHTFFNNWEYEMKRKSFDKLHLPPTDDWNTLC